MKLHVLAQLQMSISKKVMLSHELVDSAISDLTDIANEIVAEYPQFFEGYVDAMGVQGFYWTRDILTGGQPYLTFQPHLCDCSQWGYTRYTDQGPEFVPLPDDLIEAIRIYASAHEVVL